MIEFIVGAITGSSVYLVIETIRLHKRLKTEINKYQMLQAQTALAGEDVHGSGAEAKVRDLYQRYLGQVKVPHIATSTGTGYISQGIAPKSYEGTAFYNSP